MPEQLAARTLSRKVRAASLSVTTCTALTLLKLFVGFWSGSVSVLSEAVHSASDLLASGIALLSVRASDIPPDSEHPYGHGKIESISGLFESTLILVAAVYIIFQIFDRLRSPMSPKPHSISAGIAVMAVSMVANFIISAHLKRVSEETDSPALHADAEHLRADVITSVGVLTGLILIRMTGVAWLDPLVASVVAVVLLVTAGRLMYEALQLLLDIRLPDSEEKAIRTVLESDIRILGYHKLRTRKSGPQRHVDVHVQLEDECTLLYAHQVAEEIEDAIRAALPGININIHMEPYEAEMQHQREVHGTK